MFYRLKTEDCIKPPGRSNKSLLFVFFLSCLTDTSTGSQPAGDNPAQEGKIMVFHCIINVTLICNISESVSLKDKHLTR